MRGPGSGSASSRLFESGSCGFKAYLKVPGLHVIQTEILRREPAWVQVLSCAAPGPLGAGLRLRVDFGCNVSGLGVRAWPSVLKCVRGAKQCSNFRSEDIPKTYTPGIRTPKIPQ